MNVGQYPLIAIVGASAAAGAVAGWFARLHLRRERDIAVDDEINPELDERIAAAARTWATAHGRPEAESLIADKLRLGVRLRRGRQHRRRS